MPQPSKTSRVNLSRIPKWLSSRLPAIRLIYMKRSHSNTSQRIHQVSKATNSDTIDKRTQQLHRDSTEDVAYMPICGRTSHSPIKKNAPHHPKVEVSLHPPNPARCPSHHPMTRS